MDRAREALETLRGLRVPVTFREYYIGHEISHQNIADLSAWLEEKVLSRTVLPGYTVRDSRA